MDGACHECSFLPRFFKTAAARCDFNGYQPVDKSGIDLCQEVKEKFPSVFVIGLSNFNQQSFIQKMMDNGVSSYVLKNATQDELGEAVETVMKYPGFYENRRRLILC